MNKIKLTLWLVIVCKVIVQNCISRQFQIHMSHKLLLLPHIFSIDFSTAKLHCQNGVASYTISEKWNLQGVSPLDPLGLCPRQRSLRSQWLTHSLIAPLKRGSREGLPLNFNHSPWGRGIG